MPHARKRQNQRTIPTYFALLSRSHTYPSAHPSSSNDTNPARSNAPYGGSLTPPSPPTTIQSSLLNVGMRVRKAVGDGYQTKSKSFSQPSGGYNGMMEEHERSRYSMTTPTLGALAGGSKDLIPCSGMHAVGGYGVQEGFSSGIGRARVDGAMPSPYLYEEEVEGGFPGSSQESMASTVSTDSMPNSARRWGGAQRNKRTLEADEAEDEQEVTWEMENVYGDVLPSRNTAFLTRPIATPRTRTAGQQDVFDFEEAEFLRQREEMMDVDI